MNYDKRDLERAYYALYLKPGYTREQVIMHHRKFYENWAANENDNEKSREVRESYQKELDYLRDVLLAELNRQDELN